MELEDNKKAVEDLVRKEVFFDEVKSQFSSISRFGILEMSR
jgi:Ribonuclease G/E